MKKELICITITGNYPGLKKVVRTFCLISSFLLWISCQEETPEHYQLTFQNNYFEDIDSLYINSKKTHGSVHIGDNIPIGTVKYGEHTIVLYTSSGLVIDSNLKLVGNTPEIVITINSYGHLFIRANVN